MNKKMKILMAASVSVLATNCAAEAARYDAQSTASGASEKIKIQWNIPAQPLTDALIAWSEQSNYVILIQDDLAAGVKSRALIGSYTSFEALERLLSPSTLTYKIRNDTTLVVTPRLQPASLQTDRQQTRFAMAEQETSAVAERRASAQPEAERIEQGGASGETDEVVVTGTRIRGAQPAAPLRVVTRTQIDQSGFGDVGDLVRSFPEVFAGGQNPGVIASTGGAGNQNVSNASTVNLRGIGTDATLVLLNGRRLAGDTFFQAVDISGIPLAAVERVEIVADGASSLYGSDAVAGVVNFILRDDFEGAELTGRVGGATRGGAFEQTYAALGGAEVGGVHLLANYEYAKQNGLTAGDRDLTSDAVPGAHLLRPQERHSLFLSAGGDLTDRLAFSTDAILSKRNVDYLHQPFETAAPLHISTDTPAFTVGSTLEWKATDRWRLALNGVVSASRNDGWTRSPASDSNTRYENALGYGEILVEGAIGGLPGGDIRTAFGGGWRHEDYERSSETTPSLAVSGDREIRYAFAEALIPVVEESEDRFLLRSLMISLAGRFEDYSDFGSTTTPKVGVRYEPFTGLTLRGTWGESFRAPSFQQLFSAQTAILYPASVFSQPGGGEVIFATGGNPDLGPERSRSWTAGADFDADFDGDAPLTLSATFFAIDYDDRVVVPVSPGATALINPAFSDFVERDPAADRQAELIAGVSRFVNLTGAPYDPASVVAIVNNAQQNAMSQTVRGVDISYRQFFDLSGSSLTAFANTTWLDIRQQNVPSFPETVQSGTIANPPDWRARGGLTWEMSGLAATGIVNYVSGAADTGVTPNEDIAAWTTVDANLAYDFGQQAGALSDLRIALSVTNLFDRDPPYAFSPSLLQQGIYFDSTTSSPLGRIVAVTLRKRF